MRFDVYPQQNAPGTGAQAVPVISGGGGGNTTAQVAASGKVLPVADAAGVTVDTTTYANDIKGSGHYTTLVFPADTGAIAMAISGDAHPRWVMAADAVDGFYFANGTQAVTAGASLSAVGGGTELQLYAPPGGIIHALQGPLEVATAPANPSQVARLVDVSPRFTITSGALSTVQLVTATGAQIVTTRDAETVTPCTFNPGAATTATVTVALSPDNVTYSTLGIETEPAGVAFDGTIHLVKVRVPAGWYLKLTVNAQAVLGLTTYY